MKYLITQTIPQWVTYYYETEALNEKEAELNFKCDETDPQGYDMGEFIHGINVKPIIVELIEETETKKGEI